MQYNNTRTETENFPHPEMDDERCMCNHKSYEHSMQVKQLFEKEHASFTCEICQCLDFTEKLETVIEKSHLRIARENGKIQAGLDTRCNVVIHETTITPNEENSRQSVFLLSGEAIKLRDWLNLVLPVPEQR